jgi:hypothetical protein
MAVYYPETIESQEIYGIVGEGTEADSGWGSLKNVTYPSKIIPVITPQVPTANDTIGHSINTKTNKILGSYSFGKVGSLQVGNYVNGTSGDIRITPDGITARNSSGTNTFAIDGTTGNASFFGTIQAGSVVVGYVASTGGQYTTTAATAAKVMLLPDANTGIVAYASDGTTVVFKVVVGGTDVGDVQLGNYGGNNGALWDNSAGTFNIRGTMNAGTITGTLIKTSASGTRVQMDADGDNIAWYDNGNDMGLKISLTEATDATIQTYDGRDLDIIVAGSDIRINNANLKEVNEVVASTFTGGTLSGSHTGSGSFSSVSMSGAIDMNSNSVNEVNRIEGSSGYMDFNESGRLQVNNHIDPSSSGSYNLGGSSRYWNEVNYKTLQDRGCLGWFDEGTELQDGTLVKDTDALLSIKKHPSKLTVYGKPMLDYTSLPKSVYVKAANHSKQEYPRCAVCDEPYCYYDPVEKKELMSLDGLPEEVINRVEKIYPQDAAETTALISIMLGAIKELTLEVNRLKSSKI